MATMTAVKPRPGRAFLPLQEAAEWYEIGYSTLRKMLADGRLHRHTRPGDKRVYLAVEELEQVLTPKRGEDDA